MNSILKIENLKKIYHTKHQEILAVEDFTFELYPGEFIAIVGPSGCGKSTILSILSELENKSSGNIFMKNNSKIGYMLQNDSLFEWRTILNNCIIGLEITNNLTQNNKNYVNKLLKSYGLYEFKDSYPSSLSGGMRQRVVRMLLRHYIIFYNNYNK